MSRVDFYVLSEKHTVDVFICQLTQKIWHQGHEIYIHTDHQQHAEQLDSRLWTFSDISFVPHQMWSGSETITAPICIGWQRGFTGSQDVLMNLNRVVPEFNQQFARIVEIVSLDAFSKQTGRDHFRQYRDLGYTIESHNL